MRKCDMSVCGKCDVCDEYASVVWVWCECVANISYYEHIDSDKNLDFRLGRRDVSLFESLLIDPGTGHVVDINFDVDSLILTQDSFDYINSLFLTIPLA